MLKESSEISRTLPGNLYGSLWNYFQNVCGILAESLGTFDEPLGRVKEVIAKHLRNLWISWGNLAEPSGTPSVKCGKSFQNAYGMLGNLWEPCGECLVKVCQTFQMFVESC